MFFQLLLGIGGWVGCIGNEVDRDEQVKNNENRGGNGKLSFVMQLVSYILRRHISPFS